MSIAINASLETCTMISVLQKLFSHIAANMLRHSQTRSNEINTSPLSSLKTLLLACWKRFQSVNVSVSVIGRRNKKHLNNPPTRNSKKHELALKEFLIHLAIFFLFRLCFFMKQHSEFKNIHSRDGPFKGVDYVLRRRPNTFLRCDIFTRFIFLRL